MGAGHPKCMELTDWKCPVGEDHKWPASYNSISRPKASGCPFCPSAGGSRKPSAKWNFAVIYPEYLETWHWERNEKGPEEYLPRSNKAVWWKCQKSELHDWQASPNGMVGTKSIESKAKGCRYCRGLKVCADNCLAFLYPEIAKQWDYTKNKDSPKDVFAGSGEPRHWICAFGHRWKSPIKARTTYGHGCRLCIQR